MGFSPEIIARLEEQEKREQSRSRWICQEGWHDVQVVGHRRSSKPRGGAVIFTVRGSRDRELNIPFSLSVPILRTEELLRFVRAALQWPSWEGNPISVGRAAEYGLAKGKRIRVLVRRDGRGLHEVVDWRPVKVST